MEILASSQWQRPASVASGTVRELVAALMRRIERGGRDALKEISLELDGFEPQELPLDGAAFSCLPVALRDALQCAHERIAHFARLQRKSLQDTWHRDAWGCSASRFVPVERMAAYIPGGRFPLCSSALMTLTPAREAGVTERVAFTPSSDPVIGAAAWLAGATRLIRLGGAQAIFAAAFGSPWNAPCDVVAGPGNAFVTAAKALVQDRLRIDSLAGPSELLVLFDEHSRLPWIAADLLAQAEHDPQALSLALSCHRGALEALAALLPPEREGMGPIQLVHAPNRSALLEFANALAPEHLLLAMTLEGAERLALRHYGTLFLGENSAPAFGDYCSGPNHTLPTSGQARNRGGLSVLDFLRCQTEHEFYDDGVLELAHTAIELARAEGLHQHQVSLELRMRDLGGTRRQR